jgi:hypothetical protein
MHRMGFTSRSPVASTTRRFRPKQIEPRDRRPRFDRNLVLREAHHEGHRSAFPRSRKIAVPPALPAARPGIAIPRKKGAECRARGCGRPRVKAVGRGEPSQRRQADSDEGTSGVHRAACDRDVLPGLSREMARHRKRPGAASGRVEPRDRSHRAVVETAICWDSGNARPRPASMSCDRPPVSSRVMIPGSPERPGRCDKGTSLVRARSQKQAIMPSWSGRS